MSTSTEIVTNEHKDPGAPIRAGTEALPARVESTQIVDQGTLDTAASLLGDIKGLRKAVASTFDPIVAHAHATHKSATTARREHDEPLAKMETAIKLKIGAYVDAEEKRRRIADAEAQAKARKADEEQRLAEAAALEAAGQTEAAEAVINEEPPPPPPPQAEKVRAGGISLRTTWKAEVVDMRKLLKAAGRAKPDLNALALFQDDKVKAAVTARASQIARALKGNMIVDGIVVVEEKGVASR